MKFAWARCRQLTEVRVGMSSSAFTRAFYLAHKVAATTHTFYVPVLLDLRTGVWAIMSFISKWSFLSLPRSQTSPPPSHAAQQHLNSLCLCLIHYCRLSTHFKHFLIRILTETKEYPRNDFFKGFCKLPFWAENNVPLKSKRKAVNEPAAKLRRNFLTTELSWEKNPNSCWSWSMMLLNFFLKKNVFRSKCLKKES